MQRVLLALALSLVWLHAPAQDRAPIRLVVPYGAGGPIDVTARILAEKVKDTLGPVIIDNKPGAGGNLGVDLVAKAAPDGRTVGIAAVATHAINPWLFARMPFNAEHDFAPITQWVRVPNVLVMNTETAKRLGIRRLADLISYARAHPGRLNFGSGGNGSPQHIAMALFSDRAGVQLTHVPYKGATQAAMGVAGNEIQVAFQGLATVNSLIQAKKLRW